MNYLKDYKQDYVMWVNACFPFLKVDTIIKAANYFKEHKETCGNFVTSKIVSLTDDKYLNTMIIEMANTKYYDFVVGQYNHVYCDPRLRNFHTHPFIDYYENNVLIGPPSGGDMFGFLSNYIDCFNNKKPLPQMISVISIEGIYIVSLTPETINYINNSIRNKSMTEETAKIICDSYEFPFEQRIYYWKDSSSSAPNNLVETNINNYFEFLKEHTEGYFQIEFTHWNRFTDKTLFSIKFFNCDPRDYDYEL
jgi:hypothetical protein